MSSEPRTRKQASTLLSSRFPLLFQVCSTLRSFKCWETEKNQSRSMHWTGALCTRAVSQLGSTIMSWFVCYGPCWPHLYRAAKWLHFKWVALYQLFAERPFLQCFRILKCDLYFSSLTPWHFGTPVLNFSMRFDMFILITLWSLKAIAPG